MSEPLPKKATRREMEQYAQDYEKFHGSGEYGLGYYNAVCWVLGREPKNFNDEALKAQEMEIVKKIEGVNLRYQEAYPVTVLKSSKEQERQIQEDLR